MTETRKAGNLNSLVSGVFIDPTADEADPARFYATVTVTWRSLNEPDQAVELWFTDDQLHDALGEIQGAISGLNWERATWLWADGDSGSRVQHIFRKSQRDDPRAPALCGRRPSDWNTSGWDYRPVIAALQNDMTCKRCLAAAAKETTP